MNIQNRKPKTEKLKTGISKTGISKTGISKTGISKTGISKIGISKNTINTQIRNVKLIDVDNRNLNLYDKYKFVLDYFNRNNVNNININDFYKMIYSEGYCEKILGSGMMGVVYEYKVGNKMTFYNGKKNITVPIVIKKSYIDERSVFDINIIDNHCYISSFINLNCECIIFIYLLKLWYKKISPHLPLFLGYSTCQYDNVVNIITERHGLGYSIYLEKKVITYQLFGFDDTDNVNIQKYNTDLSTLESMYQYIKFKRIGNKITLPNNITCDINELIDYILLSYIVTHFQMKKKNLILQDMHAGNIFIHWLNKNSYMGDEYIGDIENITYKLKSSSYQIKTFGFIIKLGDVGASIYKPNEKITISGLSRNVEKYYSSFKIFEDSRYSINKFLLWNFKNYLPYSILKNTIVNKIFNEYPYNEISELDSENMELFKDMFTSTELLQFFSKYKVNKNNKTNNKNNITKVIDKTLYVMV
jgi:hypothetical protein